MHFLNRGHLYETTARFSHAVLGEYPADAASVGVDYRSAVSALRPRAAVQAGLSVTYEDGPWAQYCRDHGIFEHILRGAGTSNDSTRKGWEEYVYQALQHVRELNEDLAAMVELLVTDVVVLGSGVDGGGSANTLPGLVLMSPGNNWGPAEYAECLVHEGLHTGLFVMDTVYGLFTRTSEELEAEEFRALSAVKIGQKRPLDKAFHAAVVAIPLMYMQHCRGVSTLVDLYTESLREACADLVRQRENFTPYGQMLLREMCAWSETIDFGQVAHSISSSEFAGYRPDAVSAA